jgi:nickel-dependent lactate racemase
MLLYSRGSEKDVLSEEDLRKGLAEAFAKLGAKKKVLAIPPDFTRFHSHAGVLTRLTWEYYKEKLTDILPALGTHAAMTEKEIKTMFGSTPLNLFRVHDWRKDVVTLGDVPSEYVHQDRKSVV